MLSRRLREAGHTLRRFVRVSAAFIEEQGLISWDPYSGQLPERYLEGCDTVINLCGVNIGASRWTADRRRLIIDSRVIPTELIARKLAGMPDPPHQLLNASAAGYYGLHDVGRQLTESNPSGQGFLSELCRRWEEATSIADWAGIQVARMRFGVVLGDGGFLDRLVPLFRANLGGRLGHGQQPLSWIAIPDLVRAVEFLIEHPVIAGGVNVSSPFPVTNEELTLKLAEVLGKRAFLPVPGWALKLVYGDLAHEALLNGQAIVPKKLKDAGFEFKYPELSAALKHALR